MCVCECSAASNSLCPPWTAARQLFCLCDSPGKNTEVACHFFSRGSSSPRNRSLASCTAGRFFTIWATRVQAAKSLSCMTFMSLWKLLWVWPERGSHVISWKQSKKCTTFPTRPWSQRCMRCMRDSLGKMRYHYWRWGRRWILEGFNFTALPLGCGASSSDPPTSSEGSRIWDK